MRKELLVLLTTLFPCALMAQDAQQYGAVLMEESKRPYEIAIRADLLYLRASEDMGEYTLAFESPIPSHNAVASAQGKGIHYSWDPGLKVELSVLRSLLNWELALRFTHHHTDRASQIHRDEPVLVPLLVGGPGEVIIHNAEGRDFARSARASWNLYLNLFDLECRHRYFISNKVSLEPHLGVQVAQIGQDLEAKYSDMFFTTASLYPAFTPFGSRNLRVKRNQWAVGPKLGVEMLFQTLERVNLFAAMHGSLLYSFEKREELFHAEVPAIAPPNIFPAATINKTDIEKPRQLSPTAYAAVGLERVWKGKKGSELVARLGYCSYYFWNQGVINRSDSLELKGFNLSAKVSF